MQTAHEIVRAYVANHNIDLKDFNVWFDDAGYPQEEANVHDSRYMQHLMEYVQERFNRTFTLPSKNTPAPPVYKR